MPIIRGPILSIDISPSLHDNQGNAMTPLPPMLPLFTWYTPEAIERNQRRIDSIFKLFITLQVMEMNVAIEKLLEMSDISFNSYAERTGCGGLCLYIDRHLCEARTGFNSMKCFKRLTTLTHAIRRKHNIKRNPNCKPLRTGYLDHYGIMTERRRFLLHRLHEEVQAELRYRNGYDKPVVLPHHGHFFHH